MGGCFQPYYGTVTFQHHHEAFGLGGGGVEDEQTTYTVEAGAVTGTVATRADFYGYDADVRTDDHGCQYFWKHTYGTQKVSGRIFVDPQTDKLVAELVPTSTPVTYAVQQTDNVGCGPATMVESYQPTIVTHPKSSPEALKPIVIDNIEVSQKRPDNSYIGNQYDCSSAAYPDIEYCLVTFNVHPQPAAGTTAK